MVASMKLIGLAMLAAVAAGDAPVSCAPTHAELAKALASFTGKPVDGADLRQITCTDFKEEPTEYACHWQQEDGKGWRKYSAYLAIDGRDWILTDGPKLSR